jgi:Mg2+-importing ATPase
VIFVIRTRLPVWQALPHPWLTATSLTALLGAVLLALTPLGAPVGFTSLSVAIILVLTLIVAAYLATTEVTKRFALPAPRVI